MAPFSIWLPHAGLALTGVLTVIIGLILASAFSAILVYAQELMPGKVGLVAGLFFGLAFGIAGIGAAVLGRIADQAGIIAVFHGCAWLPLIGLLTVLLPDLEPGRREGVSGEVEVMGSATLPDPLPDPSSSSFPDPTREPLNRIAAENSNVSFHMVTASTDLRNLPRETCLGLVIHSRPDRKSAPSRGSHPQGPRLCRWFLTFQNIVRRCDHTRTPCAQTRTLLAIKPGQGVRSNTGSCCRALWRRSEA